MTAPDSTSRAAEAKTVVEAVKVLDRYGFTTAARIAVQAAQAIVDGKVDHAPRFDKSAP